jgi:hypothetical protein
MVRTPVRGATTPRPDRGLALLERLELTQPVKGLPCRTKSWPGSSKSIPAAIRSRSARGWVRPGDMPGD